MKNNIGIQAKVILLAILPLIIAITILSSFFINEQIKDSNKSLSNKGNAIIEQLSPVVEFGLFSENIQYLTQIANITLKDPDVTEIVISNKINQAIYKKTKEHNTDTGVSLIHFERLIYSHQIDFDELDVSLTNNNKTNLPNLKNRFLGKVSIALSTENTDKFQTKIIRNELFIVFVFILFTSIIAIYIAKGITSPILKLSNTMKAIKNGVFTQNFDTGASGEIAILESGVKEMTTSLIEARKREKETSEHQLFIEKTKAQITLESIGEGVITTNKHGHITYMNPAAEKLLKCSSNDYEGLPLSSIFRVRLSPGNKEFTYPYNRAISEGVEITHESPISLIRTDKSEILIRDTTTPIYDRLGEIVGVVLVFHDYTAINTASEKVIYLSSHDKLTGLLTRHEFESQVDNIISISTANIVHSLCFFDLDKFKFINDTCGHQAGDQLLSLIASEIKLHIRKYDLITRIGSDEFVVFFRDCSEEKAQSLATEIRNAVKNINFNWDSQVFNVSVSVGFVSVKSGIVNIKELIGQAQSACENAKDSGGDQVSNNLSHEKKENIQETAWKQRLEEAIDKNKFIIMAQKIKPVNRKEDDTACFELTIGYRENNKILLADEFLSYADKYYLMQEIDRWLITETLNILKKYPEQANKININLNLSGQALTDDSIMEYIVALIDEKGLQPENITFELSETSIIANHEYTIQFVEKLKAVGFQFAIDNFGKGLCSLSYLKRIPVTKLKMSGELVKSIQDDPVNLAIINSINHVCHTLNIKTIAKNIDTHELYELVRTTDSDYMQGAVIQKHMLFEDILKNY